MSEIRKIFSQLMQSETELKFFISTFYVDSHLKNFSFDVLLEKVTALQSHINMFSTRWLVLVSSRSQVQAEGPTFQKEIQEKVPELKVTNELAEILCADISLLPFTDTIRETCSIAKNSLPIITDFTTLKESNLLNTAIRFSHINTSLSLLHHSMKKMHDIAQSEIERLSIASPNESDSDLQHEPSKSNSL